MNLRLPSLLRTPEIVSGSKVGLEKVRFLKDPEPWKFPTFLGSKRVMQTERECIIPDLLSGAPKMCWKSLLKYLH